MVIFDGGIITKGQVGGWLSNSYMLRASGGHMRFFLSDGENQDLIVFPLLGNGEWRYVVATSSLETGLTTIYVDGEEFSSIPRSVGQIRTDSGPLRIGQGHSSSGGNWFNGNVDEVMNLQ